MSLADEYESIFNEWNNKIQKILTRSGDAAQKLVSKASKKIYQEFGEYQRNVIEIIFNNAVDEFYDSYQPLVYKRNRSLYNLLDIPVDSDGMLNSIEPDFRDMYNESKMTIARNGGSLFDTVFVRGYHGGASSIGQNKAEIWGHHPNPGVPYYRTRGIVRYPNGGTSFHRYGRWGRKAFKSKSPFYSIAEKIYSFDSPGGEWDGVFNSIVNEQMDICAKEIQTETDKIAKEVFGG